MTTDTSALVARLRAKDNFNYIDLRNEAAIAIVALETRVKALEVLVSDVWDEAVSANLHVDHELSIWSDPRYKSKDGDSWTSEVMAKLRDRIIDANLAANAHGEAGK